MMKKVLSIVLIAVFLLTGCAKKVDKYALKILVPTGAPAVATLPLSSAGYNVAYESTPANLQAALINPSPEYDLVIAPVNVGVKLIQAGKTDYLLHSIVTWGNLYVMESSKADAVNGLAVFGENAVPGLVYEAIKDQLNLDVPVTYYPAVSDAQTALLTGQAKYALLASPLTAASISKAQSLGFTITQYADVQTLWKTKYNVDSYPQAGLFVSKAAYTDHATLIDENIATMSTYVKNHSTLKADIDAIGAQTLGVPSSDLIVSAWDTLNINVTPAKDHTAELTAFLKIFNIQYQEDNAVK